jgi:hypothetical protein
MILIGDTGKNGEDTFVRTVPYKKQDINTIRGDFIDSITVEIAQVEDRIAELQIRLGKLVELQDEYLDEVNHGEVA